MKILDAYILKKFFGTLFFILLLLVAIFIVVDYNEKQGKIADNQIGFITVLVNYYFYYTLWAVNSFLAIVVFISVIFFTSRVANNTEIVAIISSGVSFYRFSKPYILGALFITISALTVNHFIMPWSNIKMNENKYMVESKSKQYEKNYSKSIESRIGYNELLFINSYNRLTKNGNGFHYIKMDSSKRITEEIMAQNFRWNDTDSAYVLQNFVERRVNTQIDRDQINQGKEVKKKFKYTPDELLPESYVAETMNSVELMDFIKKEKDRGSGNVNAYQTELYRRTSLPVAIFILTIFAVSLASVKRRGGIGLNLAIGITIAFVYIMSFQTFTIFAQKNSMPALLAVWIPNIIFGIFGIYLYFKRARA